jgi:hypothetical protein
MEPLGSPRRLFFVNAADGEQRVRMEHAPMPPSANRVFQLTESTVSPTRPAGRSEDGMPREETIPAIKSEKFVDPAGNICDVYLRNGRVLSNDATAEKYEQTMRKDQIMAGSLPLGECPYTAEYRRWTNSETLLGEIPAGVKACNGAPGGCEHLKPVIAARLAKTLKKWESEQRKEGDLTQAQAEGLVKAMAAGLASSSSPATADARKAIRKADAE